MAFADFRLQCEAVQFCDIEVLVVLPVYLQVLRQVAGIGKMQGKLVAQLPGRLQRAVLFEKCPHLRMIGDSQPGSEIACFEIGPEDIVPQHLLMQPHGLPVAAFYFRVDRLIRCPLLFNIVGFGRRSAEWCSGQQDAGNDSMKSPCRIHEC